MKLLLYCTKAKPYLVERLPFNEKKFYQCRKKNDYYSLNGKIVAECDFEVEYFNVLSKTIEGYKEFERKDVNYVLERSCLSYTELVDYLGENKVGYAIHIKNLHIFDKPRELYDCLIHPKIEPRYYGCEHLSKAPQNMMYVELDDIKYVLISIRPEWICKILNGEKTIEVRKKVLKEML